MGFDAYSNKNWSLRNKKYNIKAIYYPTSGISGFGMKINEIEFYSPEHGAKSIELVDDKYFIVDLGEHLEILDHDLKVLTKIAYDCEQDRYNVIQKRNESGL